MKKSCLLLFIINLFVFMAFPMEPGEDIPVYLEKLYQRNIVTDQDKKLLEEMGPYLSDSVLNAIESVLGNLVYGHIERAYGVFLSLPPVNHEEVVDVLLRIMNGARTETDDKMEVVEGYTWQGYELRMQAKNFVKDLQAGRYEEAREALENMRKMMEKIRFTSEKGAQEYNQRIVGMEKLLLMKQGKFKEAEKLERPFIEGLPPFKQPEYPKRVEKMILEEPRTIKGLHQQYPELFKGSPYENTHTALHKLLSDKFINTREANFMITYSWGEIWLIAQDFWVALSMRYCRLAQKRLKDLESFKLDPRILEKMQEIWNRVCL